MTWTTAPLTVLASGSTVMLPSKSPCTESRRTARLRSAAPLPGSRDCAGWRRSRLNPWNPPGSEEIAARTHAATTAAEHWGRGGVPRTARAPVRSAQTEGRVAVGDQQRRVRTDPECPTAHTHDIVEQRARIASGEQDREPGDDYHDNGTDAEEREHDDVRDHQQPLHQR